MNNINNELELIQNYIKNFENDKFYYFLSTNDIVTEFIQTKIIEYVSSKEYGKDLILIGGCSLRLLHNGIRKSYDLDYDSENISEEKFNEICNDIIEFLTAAGHEVKKYNNNYYPEDTNTGNFYDNFNKKIYHCKFSVKTVIFKDQKKINLDADVSLTIKIDMKDGLWDYNKEFILPQRSIYGIPVLTAKVNSLLSKKISGFLGRTHNESVAKDLVDILFLLEITDPDFNYLGETDAIYGYKDLIYRLELKINNIGERIISESCEKLKNLLLDKEYQYTPLEAIKHIKTILGI